jgi:poly-beta-hydroxyalkanoate depolymerase
VALAAAVVLQPTAGSFDMEDYVRFVPQVLVEEQHATGFDR